MTFRQKKLLTVLVSPVKILVVLSQVMVVACLRFDNLSWLVVGVEEFVQVFIPRHVSKHVFVPEVVFGDARAALKRECGTSPIFDLIQEAFVRVKCEGGLIEHHLVEAAILDESDAR